MYDVQRRNFLKNYLKFYIGENWAIILTEFRLVLCKFKFLQIIIVILNNLFKSLLNYT